MAYTVFQGGSSIQFLETAGTVTTLTLPAGVTLDPDRAPRFSIFDRYVVMVNSPTRPLTIDADGIVRVLTPMPPQTPAVLTAQAGGSLSGTFLVKYSYRIYDASRKLISESALSPISASQALSSEFLRAASLQLSTDAISTIQLYRTVTGGSEFFPWVELDGNTQTSIQDDLADASLSSASVAVLGSPPRLTHVGEFRGRLWGVGLTEVDALRYTEADRMYSWPSTNSLPIPRIGEDDRGITGILARRDALAIARQNRLVEIKGETNANFRVVRLSNEVGVEADDSIAQFRDVIYFLYKDGVYTWDNSGVNCISDGKTRAWFTTDTYFNRSMLKYAVGRVDPLTNKYQLLLSAAGGTGVLDSWIEYDIKDQTWWGPHRTDAFTPTWMVTLLDQNTLPIVAHGSSSGFFYKEQDLRTDGTLTPIAFDVIGKHHDMDSPDIQKYFGQLSLLSKIQPSGTLIIDPSPGGLNAAAGASIAASMTVGREKLRRLGTGRMVKLRFTHATAGEQIELFGYELPFSELGRR